MIFKKILSKTKKNSIEINTMSIQRTTFFSDKKISSPISSKNSVNRRHTIANVTSWKPIKPIKSNLKE